MALSILHSALPYPIYNARYTPPNPTMLNSSGVATDPTTPLGSIDIDNGGYNATAETPLVYGTGKGTIWHTFSGAEMKGSLVTCQFTGTGVIATNVSISPRALAIITSGTLSAGSVGGGTMPAALLNGRDYTGCFVRTTGGTGGGGTNGANNQARRIMTYTLSTGAFTVFPNWETATDATTTFDLLLPEGVAIKGVNSVVEKPYFMFIAANGSSGDITMPSGVTNSQVYPGGRLRFISGSGAGGGGIIGSTSGMGGATPKAVPSVGNWPGGNPGSNTLVLFEPEDGLIPLPLSVDPNNNLNVNLLAILNNLLSRTANAPTGTGTYTTP